MSYTFTYHAWSSLFVNTLRYETIPDSVPNGFKFVTSHISLSCDLKYCIHTSIQKPTYLEQVIHCNARNCKDCTQHSHLITVIKLPFGNSRMLPLHRPHTMNRYVEPGLPACPLATSAKLLETGNLTL